MIMLLHRLGLLLLSGALLCSCAGETDESAQATRTVEFPLSISARSEGQNPVPGVQILLGKQLLATTGPTGNADVNLKGVEGDTLALNVKCPATYASPERPLAVGLRHLGDGSTRARFEVDCFTLVHSVVVGIRAENGPHLPVLHLRNVVGQTDDQGVAHVLLQASANERIALTLDTSKSPSILPQNPTLDFATGDSDEFWLVTQKFTAKQAPVRRVAPRPIPMHL